jgi:hypothetical protein
MGLCRSLGFIVVWMSDVGFMDKVCLNRID